MSPSADGRVLFEGADGRVVYHDDALVVIDKPSGLSVHRGLDRSDASVVDALAGAFGKLFPVHRLDRGTSGVLALARDEAAARALGRQFEARAVRKTYAALVRGRAPDEVVVDHPVPKDEGGARVPASTRLVRVVTLDVAAELEAPEALRALSWVLAIPRTGRFHQVRRHCKHVNHPIVGDANYGRGRINRWAAARLGLARLALHAVSLEFAHPRSGEPLRFATWSADFTPAMAHLGVDAGAIERAIERAIGAALRVDSAKGE